MKFPRSAKILGNQSDSAPFVCVLLVLVLFMLLAALLPTPGVGFSLLTLPVADDLPGLNGPGLPVAIDSSNRLYWANSIVTEAQLAAILTNAASHSPGPPTLIIEADQSVSYGQVLKLSLLARSMGITNSLLATLPRVPSVASVP